jgi:cytosine deaminase
MSGQQFDPKQLLLEKIKANGGWVNAHAHIDRAYILNDDNFTLVNGSLQEKWDFPDTYKKTASVDDIYTKMALVLDSMIAQGVQAIGTFIDVDPIIEDKAIQAAKRIRADYGGKIEIRFINQVVKGVLEPEARKWFEIGAEFVDIIGGLPEKDAGHEAEHLDVLFETAKKYGDKPLHVHIDQFNSPDQHDTELLIAKTKEHNYQGKVTAIHGLSIAAQQQATRQAIYAGLVEQDIRFVACPTAWIDSRRNETLAPTHNAVTPVEEMVAAGVCVALGTDNIADIYKPFNDGDMWTELRFLLEATHTYDMDTLTAIATENGRRALFL